MSSGKTINFKTIADDYQTMANHHKQINSFGLGNIDGISYYTTSRDQDANPHAQPPIFPLLYVVPAQVTNDLKYKTWDFNTLVMDISQRDLANQVDTLSDTLQILQDIISQFRLSVTAEEGLYNNKYYLDNEVNCIPFMEKQVDLTNGWNGLLSLKTMTPLNRCAAAYNTWTGTSIVHNTINLKTFHDDFRTLSEYHKQINSFGFGEESDLSFWTEMRDKTDNTHFNSPIFPLLYVIPGEVVQKFGFMEYTFTLIVMDIIERDLTNQIDVLSDTNQIMDDIISQFRLSVTDSLGNFNAKYYLQNPVICSPFIEQYSDLTGGWTAKIAVQVMNSLDRCDAAFNSWITPTLTTTPTPTPTVTNTPSVTPTSTPTNTPTQTQTNTPSQTSTPTVTPTNTNTPTVTQTETPTSTPTNTPTNTNTPTPSVTSTETPSPTPSVTPTETNTPTPSITATQTSTPTPSITPSVTQTQTPSATPTETPTNTPTSTNTPTPSVTQTPTETTTPTVTPSVTPTTTNTPTPSITPTFTPTPSSTPGPVLNECIWNENADQWNQEYITWDNCPSYLLQENLDLILQENNDKIIIT